MSGIPKQFRDDAVFPADPDIEREEGEPFWDWIKRHGKASGEWLDAHRKALADPRNMTTEYLRTRVTQHDWNTKIFTGAPFVNARIAAAQPNDTIESYREELARRDALTQAAE